MRSNKLEKRIVLLDTHAIIHRAYHALPADFSSPTGQPTGALYGLVSIMLKLIVDLSPDYLIACYDLPDPTHRHEVYAEYKGTRLKLDDALIAQLIESKKVFEAFSIPTYELKGFEADDLLGTIASELKDQPIEVVITSGDMDTLQLVEGTRVRVYTPKKGLSETILYDEKAVTARFGFSPNLIPDWKGLRGDPSDNIKGVPGIGEKTATELITKFGSIESLYATLAEGDEKFIKNGIKPRIIGLLKEHEELARFSKSLATIRVDAPISFSVPEYPWKEEVDTKKIFDLFDTLGFHSLRERVRSVINSSTATFPESDETSKDASVAEDVPPLKLAEAQVMLWLISSDFTNPSFDDILAFTSERSFDAAYAVLEKQLNDLGRVKEVFEKIERPLIPVARAMGERGILIDPSKLKTLAKTYRGELETLEKKIYASAGHEFNINSPKQLGEILFDELKLIPERQKKTSGGQRSTRESELEKIRGAHPIIDNILDYRELKKLLSTYIDNLPPLLDTEHRLHAEFLQTGTTTGRMASQNPNLQNIPLHSERGKAIRHAFVATPGFTLVSLDYSQIELRLAAILSGDEQLCDIFRNGRDVHREVAARVFHVEPENVDSEMRRKAKVINFGILYGMGANALRQQLGTTTSEAHTFSDAYFTQFKTLAEYLESTRGFARKHGYTETLFGRRRQFPEMKSTLPYVRAQAERMAINAPIQGTQADIIKLAMVRAKEMIEKEKAESDAYLLLQVHDELVYEIRSSMLSTFAERIRTIMESILTPEQTHGVAIIADMKSGQDWGSMQSA